MKAATPPRILSLAELDRVRGGEDLATAPEDADTEAAKAARNAMVVLTISAGVP